MIQVSSALSFCEFSIIILLVFHEGNISFSFSYDHIEGGKKFFDFIQILNTLQKAIIIEPVTYNETP
jgi:hypothetical protein